jgi:hypothetical protein
MESLHETQSVNLANASIDTDGIRTLASALKENTSVTKLNLFNNEIDAEGAAALADALKVNTTITTV